MAEVTRITHPRWVARVLTTELTGTNPADLRLNWHIDPGARRTPEIEIFGKCRLVSDHDHWTTAEVVAGYCSQNDIESGFRQPKDRTSSGVPMFHWTESEIRVHVLPWPWPWPSPTSCADKPTKAASTSASAN